MDVWLHRSADRNTGDPMRMNGQLDDVEFRPFDGGGVRVRNGKFEIIFTEDEVKDMANVARAIEKRQPSPSPSVSRSVALLILAVAWRTMHPRQIVEGRRPLAPPPLTGRPSPRPSR